MYKILNDLKSFDYFAQLVGNEELKERLTILSGNGTLPHAILIAGEDGCGRNLLARLLARTLLKDSADLVSRGVHPDCVVVAGEGISGMIAVKRVREAAFELNKSPVMTDNNRVAIIKDAGSLNKSSSNALLKIIEQPPEGVTFILTARSEAELIDTVLSRCARFRVAPIETERCVEFIKRIYPSYDDKRLRDLCVLYGGRIGLVKEVLSTPERLSLSDSAVLLCKYAMEADKLMMLSVLECAKTRQELKQLLFDLSRCMCRELEKSVLSEPLLSRLEDAVLEAYRDIDRNVNQKLLCTQLVARL
ncbi:MAG: AAA family ATPase [Oscillospiraceae bacterium]